MGKQWSVKFAIILLGLIGFHENLAAAEASQGPAENVNSESIQAASVAVNEPGKKNSSIDSPAMDKEGRIYAANILNSGSIAVASNDGNFTEWFTLPDSGKTSSVRINAKNQMFVSDYKNHRIYRIEIATKKYEIYFEEQTLNQPNDMAIAQDGTIYFSDPSWSKIKSGALYRLSPDRKLELLATNLRAVNGLDLSPGEDKLYFTESTKGELYEMDLPPSTEAQTDGAAPHIKLLHTFKPDTVDGIRTDVLGNIFVTRIRQKAVDQLNSQGLWIRSLPLLGSFPTNLCFGEKEHENFLFVTTRDQNLVEKLPVDAAGREWMQLNK
jgi:sugar lactone lactonase YvrE